VGESKADSFVSATQAEIKYVGRTLVNQTSGEVVFDWSGIEIWFAVQADTVTLRLLDTGSGFNVFIDGKLDHIFYTSKNVSDYVLATNLNQPTQFRLTKRTEPYVGVTHVVGIRLKGGKEQLLPVHMVNNDALL
jgi:hypothetical protein